MIASSTVYVVTLLHLVEPLLDISDIKFVINFDFPSCSEDYVHRIGRTARSDRTGTSYTFFTTGNAKQAKDLICVLKEANQHVNPKLIALAEQARGMFGRSKYEDVIYRGLFSECTLEK